MNTTDYDEDFRQGTINLLTLLFKLAVIQYCM